MKHHINLTTLYVKMTVEIVIFLPVFESTTFGMSANISWIISVQIIVKRVIYCHKNLDYDILEYCATRKEIYNSQMIFTFFKYNCTYMAFVLSIPNLNGIGLCFITVTVKMMILRLHSLRSIWFLTRRKTIIVMVISERNSEFFSFLTICLSNSYMSINILNV